MISVSTSFADKANSPVKHAYYFSSTHITKEKNSRSITKKKQVIGKTQPISVA